MKSSNYYQYDFISPGPIFALVQEELRSYFDAGAVDNALFSLWMGKVLKKLTRGTLPIRHGFVQVEKGKGRLPVDFKYMREVWMLEEYQKIWSDPSATYSYVLDTSMRIDNPEVSCDLCAQCENPLLIQAVYKHTQQVFARFQRKHFLRPGHIQPTAYPCLNDHSSDPHIYELKDGALETSFPEGSLYCTYYAEELDEYAFQLVPDNIYIEEAIEFFLKYKIFEQLFNQASDESFQQSRFKMEKAKAEYEEKFIIAETWMKKETPQMKQDALQRQKQRLHKYKIR
jgi:hypothetical protein